MPRRKRDASTSGSFELIQGNWLRRFEKALADKVADIRFMSPFIKAGAVEELLARRRFRSIRVLTRFNLEDCRARVSDLDALRQLLRRGARVKGVKGLHSKLYVFDQKMAILGSANLTRAALRSNHELGVVVRDSAALNECTSYFDRMWSKARGELTHGKLKRWQREIDDAVSRDKLRGKEMQLRDYGSKVDHELEVELPPAEAEALERQVFVKIFGTAGNRVDLDQSIHSTVKEDGSHWACGYPRKRRPKQPRDGDIIYFARMVKSDYRIYGRGVALAHVPKRDDASKADIQDIWWKKDWPHYVRIHDAEFIDGNLGDGVSLMEMFDQLQSVALASTYANALKGPGNNLEPRSSLRHKAAVKLAAPGAAWLEREFNERIEHCSAISASKLAKLDLPESAKWLSDSGKAMLKCLVARLEHGRIDPGDPSTFPNYLDIAQELGIARRSWPGLGQALRRNGLDNLDEWVRRYGFPAISGFVVLKAARRRPGLGFYDQHNRRPNADAWWFAELRKAAVYPWRSLMGTAA